MLGIDEYEYYDNFDKGGDGENFYYTRRRRHSILGCLKKEIEWTSRGRVAKAFIANSKKPLPRKKNEDENLGHAPRKPKKRPKKP